MAKLNSYVTLISNIVIIGIGRKLQKYLFRDIVAIAVYQQFKSSILLIHVKQTTFKRASD